MKSADLIAENGSRLHLLLCRLIRSFESTTLQDWWVGRSDEHQKRKHLRILRTAAVAMVMMIEKQRQQESIFVHRTQIYIMFYIFLKVKDEFLLRYRILHFY